MSDYICRFFLWIRKKITCGSECFKFTAQVDAPMPSGFPPLERADAESLD